MRSEIPEIDRVVHEPARLVLLTVLSACARADFTFLQNATGLSKGNLSVQVSRLEAAKLVRVEKKFQGKRTLTMIGITPRGRARVGEYWGVMDAIRRRGLKEVVVEAGS